MSTRWRTGLTLEERHRSSGGKRGQLADQRMGNEKLRRLLMEPSEFVLSWASVKAAMQATPLQMVNIASTVINGGSLYRPFVTREIRRPNGRDSSKRFHHKSFAAFRSRRGRSQPCVRAWPNVTRTRRHRLRISHRRPTVFRERPARPKRPAGAARIRPGSSRGRRAITRRSRWRCSSIAAEATGHRSPRRSHATSS